jgi:hypothetical protein
MGGGAQQNQANIDQGLMNQALGPIVNSIGSQIATFTGVNPNTGQTISTNQPQNYQLGATGQAYNNLSPNIQQPYTAAGNYASQFNAANSLGAIGTGGTQGQQNATNALYNNAGVPQASGQAQSNLLNSQYYADSGASNAGQLSTLSNSPYISNAGSLAGSLANSGSSPYGTMAAQNLSGGGVQATGANQATNNLLNFAQTQGPEVQASQNVANSANTSLLNSLQNQLGGTANQGALINQIAGNQANSNMQTAQSLQSQLAGQNLTAQQAAGNMSLANAGQQNSAIANSGSLGNAVTGLQQSALSGAGNLYNATSGLQQSALEGAGSLYNTSQNTLNNAWSSAGGLANQNQSNANSAYADSGNLASQAASQYATDQSGAANIYGNVQGQQQTAQENAYSNLLGSLGLDQNTLNSFLGAGQNAGNSYFAGQQYNNQQAQQAQSGNLNLIGSILGGLGSLFG